MNKTCNIHLLSTETNSILHLTRDNFLIDVFLGIFSKENRSFGSNQHLYTTIPYDKNDESTWIKESDWCILFDSFGTPMSIPQQWKEIGVLNNGLQKVIATTDKSLMYLESDYTSYLPSIPQSFIKTYIANYNEGNKLETCEVEFTTTPIDVNGNIVGTNKEYPYEGLKCNFKINYDLKLNDSNEISISISQKEIRVKSEVETMIFMFAEKFVANTNTASKKLEINNWIKENL